MSLTDDIDTAVGNPTRCYRQDTNIPRHLLLALQGYQRLKVRVTDDIARYHWFIAVLEYPLHIAFAASLIALFTASASGRSLSLTTRSTTAIWDWYRAAIPSSFPAMAVLCPQRGQHRS